MDNLTLLVLLFLSIPAWIYYQKWNSRRRKLPPGPFPMPVIGNLLQIGSRPNRSLENLAQTYGPIMSIYFGGVYIVVVSSPEMARAILQKHDAEFSGRGLSSSVKVHDHHNMSVTIIELGAKWRMLRKILREKLFSTPRLDGSESLRQERLQKLREYLTECSDNRREINVGEATFATMTNLMWATLFSTEVTQYNTNKNQKLKEIINGITRYIGVPNLADFYPIFERLDPQGIKKKVGYYMGKLLEFVDDVIQQRIKARSAVGYQKKDDFLELLLDLSEGSEYELSVKQIRHLVTDLIIGGADTTASTTEWAMTELLLNPDKLAKLKHELKTVLGEGNQMKESDISRLPYLRATCKEVLRCHPASPLLAPHRALQDMELNGYTIHKGTKVLINVWAITKDPTLWKDPYTFEPERFLDSDIDFKGQDFELIPFGSGRRFCPGLPLAGRMLHTLVATMVHNFDWKFDVGPEGKEFHRKDVFGLALQKDSPLMATPVKV